MYKCSEILLCPLISAGLTKYLTFKENEMLILEKITSKIMRFTDLENQLNIVMIIIETINPDIINSNMILPITAIIGNIRPGIADKIDMIPLLLILLELKPDSKINCIYIWKCISSIINKVIIGNSD